MGKRLSRSLSSSGWILRNRLISLKRAITPSLSNSLFPLGLSTRDEISFWVCNLLATFCSSLFLSLLLSKVLSQLFKI